MAPCVTSTCSWTSILFVLGTAVLLSAIHWHACCVTAAASGGGEVVAVAVAVVVAVAVAVAVAAAAVK